MRCCSGSLNHSSTPDSPRQVTTPRTTRALAVPRLEATPDLREMLISPDRQNRPAVLPPLHPDRRQGRHQGQCDPAGERHILFTRNERGGGAAAELYLRGVLPLRAVLAYRTYARHQGAQRHRSAGVAHAASAERDGSRSDLERSELSRSRTGTSRSQIDPFVITDAPRGSNASRN